MPPMNYTGLILPFIVLASVCACLIKRADVYSCFMEGIESGMKTVISIFAPLLGILTASAMLRESGILNAIISLLAPISQIFRIPEGALPLALMRPISGGGSLGILSDIVSTYGANSITALTAAVMMGSTETTLYTMCVYYKNTAVKNTRRILIAALTADLVCSAASGIICSVVFGQ